MNMNRHISFFRGAALFPFRHFLVLFFAFFLSSFLVRCDSFVEVDPPASQLGTPAVFQDRATADAALASTYAKLRDFGMFSGTPGGMSHALGLYADELEFYGSTEDPSSDFFSNSVLPSNAAVAAMWSGGYRLVYEANAVLLGVENSSGISVSDKRQLMGEAFFIRGMAHFYLACVFGDVPFVAQTDYLVNNRVSRISESEAVALAKADVAAAAELLSPEYLSPSRIRPNSLAARALLARICLYRGEWAEASNHASAVINNSGLYQYPESIVGAFLKDAPSTIWQLASFESGYNTEEGHTFLFEFGPPPLSALSPVLVGAFPAGDLRREYWVGTVSDETGTFFYPSKYRLSWSEGDSQEFSVMFRISEMYLIRAESRARQGEVTGALEDLDLVRSRAGLPPSGASDPASAAAAVLEERRLELFSEAGHRFFDLKRTGALDPVLGTVKPGWASFRKVLPLPELELLLNPNLAPQNYGY